MSTYDKIGRIPSRGSVFKSRRDISKTWWPVNDPGGHRENDRFYGLVKDGCPNEGENRNQMGSFIRKKSNAQLAKATVAQGLTIKRESPDQKT